MALIEVYHVVASNLPVDANLTTDIPQGLILCVESNGNVAPANGDSAVRPPIGIAGDSRSSGVTSYTAESGASLSRNPKTSLTGALVNSAYGDASRFTQNRIADNYNEVFASGKMTVYHGGGEFWTDQYEIIASGGSAVVNYEGGVLLFASGAETAGGTALGEPESAQIGRFTTEASTSINGAAPVVGICLTAPTSYPSGVPGTETAFSALPEGGNSLTWGTFLHFKLTL